MKNLLHLAILLLAANAVQAQSTGLWRLKSFGMERYDYLMSAYQPADSAQYYYSGNRTGVPSFEWLEGILRSKSYRPLLYNINAALQYDSVHTYRGNSQGGYADANVVYTQTLNNASILGRTRLSSGNITAQETYIYNSNNQLTESVAQGYKTTYHYNSNNLPDTLWKSVYNSSTQQYDPFYTDHYSYNSNQQLQQTLRKQGSIIHTYYYSYNINGLNDYIRIMFTGGIMPTIDTVTTYTYTYTSNGDLETELRMETDAPGIGGNMENYDRHAHTYDNNHHRLEDLTYNWNKTNQNWDTFSKWTYTYTQAGLPETFESLRWDYTAANWAPMQDTNDVRTSHRLHLYYDLAWPVGIANQQNNPATIQLYPNPAGEILTFRISMETAQPFTAGIVDMQGRVLMQWKEAATKQYTRTIPTAALPPGTYVLRLTGEGLEQTKMFSVR